MSDDQVRAHFQVIRRQLTALQTENGGVWQEINAVLEDLHVIYEQMQTSLEAAEVVQEELLEQNQRVTAGYYHYQNLFDASPIAYLVIDAKGIILEANGAIAQLLNVPKQYLVGKPFVIFVAKGDRPVFCTNLSQLSGVSDAINWEISLCPRHSEQFAAQLRVAITRNGSGLIEALRIGVHDMSEYKQLVTQPTGRLNSEDIPAEAKAPMPSLPQALDGLQVLLVDDEADAREFITTVLESHGIRVMAVGSAAAALETLEQFHPNVLISDIRMPQEDGYSLIRKVRELEALQGWHIPAAALTAYLAEDQEKALAAGFESHLHKLAQPTELIEMVTRLAGRACS